MDDAAVLEKIIDDEPIPKPDETWNDAKEETWRRCLSLVKTKAYIDGRTLCIRPHNVNEFGNVLAGHGLGFCEITKECLIYLQHNPAEFIKFRH